MAKEQTKTQQFQSHIQEIVYEITGKKVSKDTAWKLYKAIINGSVEFTLNQPEDSKGNRVVSLAGIGKFTVAKTEPRGAKAGLDKDGNPIEGAVPWEFVPRVKFTFSSAIKSKVEGHFGFGDEPGAFPESGIFAKHEEPIEEAEEPEEDVTEEPENEPEEDVTEETTDDSFWDDEF